MKRLIKRNFAWIGVLAISLASLSGCGNSANKSATAEDRYSTKMEVAQETSDSGAVVEGTTEAADQYSTEGAPKMNYENTYNRKIIKNGQMTIQTKEFSKTVDGITKYLQTIGGYIESSNFEGNDFYDDGSRLRRTDLTVRVPQKQFDTFLNKGGEFGLVSSLGCSTEDVTSDYVDAEIRVKTLQTRYDRLMALMEKSNDLAQLFKIEQEISNVSYEIEKYKGTLNHFDSLVDMGTVQVEIQEVKEIEAKAADPKTLLQKMKVGFIDSCRWVVACLEKVLVLIAMLVPVLLIIIPIGFIIWFVRKKYSRKVKKVDHIEKEKN